MDFDTDLAERDWTEALSIAKTLGDSPWINRANGELGLISFLHGDYSAGALRVMGALSQAQKLKDLGGQIRYLTLIGDGLSQIGRYDQAIAMFDQAMAVGPGQSGSGPTGHGIRGKSAGVVGAWQEHRSERTAGKPSGYLRAISRLLAMKARHCLSSENSKRDWAKDRRPSTA